MTTTTHKKPRLAQLRGRRLLESSPEVAASITTPAAGQVARGWENPAATRRAVVDIIAKSGLTDEQRLEMIHNLLNGDKGKQRLDAVASAKGAARNAHNVPASDSSLAESVALVEYHDLAGGPKPKPKRRGPRLMAGFVKK